MSLELQRAEEFLRLLNQHERMLHRYALQLAPHAQDADDILQEAKLLMLRSFQQFAPDSNFPAWARRIIFNLVVSHYRKRRQHPTAACEELYDTLAASFEQAADRLEARRQHLADCLRQCTAPHQQIVQWRYRDELPIEAIARRSGRTVTAIYRLLSRLRRQLGECIDRKLALEQDL